MSAAKKIILLLWLVVASFTTASALTPGATETRVGQKSFAPLESRQAEPFQTAGLHQENAGCGYELAPESLLAAETGVQTAVDQAAFWSGRQGLNRAAAEASGLSTLETTPAGMALESQNLFSKMDYSEAIKPWEMLSKEYAQQAQGTVTAWTGGSSPMSVWNRIELPTLRWNPQVSKIIINDATQPWKTKIIYK